MLEGVSVFELGCDQRIASAWGGVGLLRSPSQASQLLHRSWWLQGICKAGDWGLRGENKKGPPFGEPFLILRMVPAPGIEPGTY